MGKKTTLIWTVIMMCIAVTGWTQRQTTYSFLAIDYDNEKLLEIGLDGQIKRSVAVGKQPHEVQIDVKNGRADHLFVSGDRLRQ
jgi:hypothetical protein